MVILNYSRHEPRSNIYKSRNFMVILNSDEKLSKGYIYKSRNFMVILNELEIGAGDSYLQK